MSLPAVRPPVRTTPVGPAIRPGAVGTSAVEPSSRPRRRATPAPGRTAVVEPSSVADTRWTRNVAAPVRTPEAAHRDRRGGRPEAERFRRHRPCRGGLRATHAKPDQHAGGKPVSHKSFAHRFTSAKQEYRLMVPLLP